MFERFTEGAIKVIMLSQEEARRMNHDFVGTEQLLLGIIGQRHGIGALSLKRLNITLPKARKAVEKYIGRGKTYVASEIPFTPRAKRVLEMSAIESKDLGQSYISTEHILLALMAEKDGIATRTLIRLNVDLKLLREIIFKNIDDTEEKVKRPLSKSEQFLIKRQKRGSRTPTLDEFSENISKEAIAGRLDPVIGREKEVLDLIAILSRRGKNNPVLVGEPGVGKTAVAEGLAQLTLNEHVPEFLEGCIVCALDLGSILAGTKYRGEFEERLKRIIEEVQRNPQVIVVIDEIHTLVGAGAAEGAVDAANILKPALARGKFRLIGATTKDEYRKYIERDPALERRFQPIYVEEPSVSTTIEILTGLITKFEGHHGLTYEKAAIEQSAALADKYIRDRFLPDKAIDVIDEAGARVRLEQRGLPEGLRAVLAEVQCLVHEKDLALKKQEFQLAEVILDREMEVRTQINIMKQADAKNKKPILNRLDFDMVLEDDVAKVVSNWTGVPVNKISGSETERLLKMEENLRDRIVGQTEAVSAVSNAIRRARVGLRNPGRPIASFIFAGPTGVGKTELTKAVADYMFMGEESMVRLDMSEFMEKHTVAKLIGSPPGYVGYNEGGILTEAVKLKPYSVVLFDEVEKAHPDVFNLLLQILDDGRLSDSQGRVIDFTNTLIVMTTNLGAKVIERQSGIKPKEDRDINGLKLVVNENPFDDWEPARTETNLDDDKILAKITKLVKEELKHFFRPEFLNRIDGIIVFSHLSKHDIWDISDIMIKQLVNRLENKGLTLNVTAPVRALLVDEGHDPLYGARPLRRVIMNYLEDQLAERCLSAELRPGTMLKVTRKNFKQFKEELKGTKSVPAIRKILRNAVVISGKFEKNLREYGVGNYMDDKLKPIESTTQVQSYFPEDENFEEIDYAFMDEDYRNPFAVSDEETFTDEIIIDIDERNVARIDPTEIIQGVNAYSIATQEKLTGDAQVKVQGTVAELRLEVRKRNEALNNLANNKDNIPVKKPQAKKKKGLLGRIASIPGSVGGKLFSFRFGKKKK